MAESERLDQTDDLTLDDGVELSLDLSCPGCGADLANDEVFFAHRVCGNCRRHFPLRARERLALLIDAGSFQETNAALVSTDPVTFHDQLPVTDRLVEDQEQNALTEAVVTGTATIGGRAAVVIALDDRLAGAAIGMLLAEKILLAMELAEARRLPLIALCAGGNARAPVGPLSLVQTARLASTAARLHFAGVPMIAILTHPTSAAMYTALAGQCDLIFAEPGAWIGAQAPAAFPFGGQSQNAEALDEAGAIDGIVDRVRLRGQLGTLLHLLTERGPVRASAWHPAANALTPATWEAIAAARHPDRPDARAYLDLMVESFVELRGSRAGSDSTGLLAGIGRLGGAAIMALAWERDGENNPPALTAALRKARRLVRLAGQLELPIVLLCEGMAGPNAAEADGPDLGPTIAHLLALLAMVPVPVVTVGIGVVAGPAALTFLLGDRSLLLDHAVLTIDQASGPPSRVPGIGRPTGESMALTAVECQRLGLADVVIPEPGPAAHADPTWTAGQVQGALTTALGELMTSGQRRLLDQRQRRLRTLGQSTPEGMAAARTELRELQEWQRAISESIADLRGRWEQRMAQRPRFTWQRPDLTDIAQRITTLRHEVGGRIEARTRGALERNENGAADRDDAPVG